MPFNAVAFIITKANRFVAILYLTISNECRMTWLDSPFRIVHMIFCIQKSSNPFVELLPYFFYFIVTGLYRLQFFIRQFLNFFQWQVKIYCNFF